MIRILGIPYFAYMVGALAELISYQIDDAVKKIQSSSKYKISPGNISGLYVLLGCLFLILIPAFIFTKVEGTNFRFDSYGKHIFLFKDGVIWTLFIMQLFH